MRVEAGAVTRRTHRRTKTPACPRRRPRAARARGDTRDSAADVVDETNRFGSRRGSARHPPHSSPAARLRCRARCRRRRRPRHLRGTAASVRRATGVERTRGRAPTTRAANSFGFGFGFGPPVVAGGWTLLAFRRTASRRSTAVGSRASTASRRCPRSGVPRVTESAVAVAAAVVGSRSCRWASAALPSRESYSSCPQAATFAFAAARAQPRRDAPPPRVSSPPRPALPARPPSRSPAVPRSARVPRQSWQPQRTSTRRRRQSCYFAERTT